MRRPGHRWYLAVCLLGIASCTFSRSYNSSVNLPEGTSPETAQEIIDIVISGNFMQKIKTEFPYLTDAQLKGLGIYWRMLKVIGEEKSKLLIVVRMNYGGQLTMEDVEAITEYGKKVVEDVVRAYFDVERGRSSQQV